MSKTFKSVSGNTSLTIELNDSGVRIYITDLRGNSLAIVTPSESAAAQALAILEAAVTDHSSDASEAMDLLRSHIRVEAKRTAEAEAQAKLEAEALELLNAHRGATGNPLAESLDGLLYNAKETWLAVARRARELNKEEGQ